MKKGKVNEISFSKTSQGAKQTWLKIDGEEYSFFPDSPCELGEIEEGDRVEYDYQEKPGGHLNLVSLGLLEKAEKSNPSKDISTAVFNANKAVANAFEPEDIEDFIEKRDRLLKDSLSKIQNEGEDEYD
jgi:hypothetical protein